MFCNVYGEANSICWICLLAHKIVVYKRMFYFSEWKQFIFVWCTDHWTTCRGCSQRIYSKKGHVRVDFFFSSMVAWLSSQNAIKCYRSNAFGFVLFLIYIHSKDYLILIILTHKLHQLLSKIPVIGFQETLLYI